MNKIKMMLAFAAVLLCGGAWAITYDAATSGNSMTIDDAIVVSSSDENLVFTRGSLVAGTTGNLAAIYDTAEGDGTKLFGTEFTLSDIVYLTAKSGGRSVNDPPRGTETIGYLFERTAETALVQFQIIDGTYVKCATYRLCQRADGIYAKKVGTAYDTTSNVTVGTFVTANQQIGSNIPDDDGNYGYRAYDVNAVLADYKVNGALTVDQSKTIEVNGRVEVKVTDAATLACPITGNGELMLVGGGTLTLTGTIAPTVRVVADNGTVKVPNTFNGYIVVNANGVYDINSTGSENYANIKLVLNGGTMTNGGSSNAAYNQIQFKNVTVTADSTVNTPKTIFFISNDFNKHDFKLNGHTLTKTGTGECIFRTPNFVGGGVIHAEQGTVKLYDVHVDAAADEMKLVTDVDAAILLGSAGSKGGPSFTGSVDIENAGSITRENFTGSITVRNVKNSGSMVNAFTVTGLYEWIGSASITGALTVTPTTTYKFESANPTLTLTASSLSLSSEFNEATTANNIVCYDGENAILANLTYETSTKTVSYNKVRDIGNLYWTSTGTDFDANTTFATTEGGSDSTKRYPGDVVNFTADKIVYPFSSMTDPIKIAVKAGTDAEHGIVLKIGHQGSDSHTNLPNDSEISIGQYSKVLFTWWDNTNQQSDTLSLGNIKIDGPGTWGITDNGHHDLVAGNVTGSAQLVVGIHDSITVKSIATTPIADTGKILVTTVNGNGTTTYTAKNPAAEIDSVAYGTVVDALSHATDDQTVTLLTNCGDAFEIPANVIVDTNTHTVSGAITGSGTIIFTGSLPTMTFTNAEWQGTVWLKNIGSSNTEKLADSIASLGNANSTVRMTNVKGYLGNSGNKTFANDFKLEFAIDGSNSVGWNNCSGWGSNKQTYKALDGDGDYIASSGGNGTCSEPILFTGDSSSFTGGIDVMGDNRAGKIVCFGAESELVSGNANAGTIIVGSGKTMQIAATKTWKAAKVTVAGTITGSGTITGNLVLTDAAASVTVASVSGTVTKTVANMQIKTVDNGDGTYTYSLFTPTASITVDGVTTYFETLQAALNAAQSGDTVTLLANVTGDLTVPANINVNAAAYTISGEIIIESGAKVIVAGNRTTNGISGEGTFVVSSGTITANNKSDGYAVDGTTIKIDGGTFKLNNAVSGGYENNKADPTINNAKFIIAEAGTLTNYGWVNMLGTIEFDYSGDAEETIMGGSSPSFRGTPNIVKSGTGAIYFDMGVATNAKFTSLTLNGGTLRTKAAVTVDELISGVTGKAVHYDTATKTYSLVDAVAKIGTVCYATLNAALDAAIADKSLVVDILDDTTTLPDGYADTCVIVGTQAWAKRELKLTNSTSTSYEVKYNNVVTTLRKGDIVIYDSDHASVTWGAGVHISGLTAAEKVILKKSFNIKSGIADNQVVEVIGDTSGDNAGKEFLYGNIGQGVELTGTGTLYVAFDPTTITIGNGTKINCGLGLENASSKKITIAGTVELNGSFDSAKGRIFLNSGAILKVPEGTDVGTLQSNISEKIAKKVRTADGKDEYELVDSPVATVDGVEFTSLSDALEAAKTLGHPVVIGKDISDNIDTTGVTIDTNGKTLTGAISGSGKIKYTKFNQVSSQVKTSLQSEAWTGTLIIDGDAAIQDGTKSGNYNTWNNFGNSNSTIELTGNISGYIGLTVDSGNELPENIVPIAPKIKLSGTVNINDGYSNRNTNTEKHRLTIFDTLSGSGEIYTSKTAADVGYKFAFEHVEDFTGTLDTRGHMKFVLGVPAAEDPFIDYGVITVRSQINGQATLKSTTRIQFENTAVIDVSESALTVNCAGTVAFGNALTIIGVSDSEATVIKGLSSEPNGLASIAVEAKETAESEPVLGSLYYDAEAQAIKFSKVSFRRWTINPTAVVDGGVDWEANNAWLEGSTPCTWGGDMSDVIAELDASVVQNIKIASTISPMRVVLTGGSDSTFVFNTAYVGSEGNYSVPVDYVITAPINASGFSGTLGLRAQIDGEITFGSATQLKFVSPTAGQRTTAYDYKLVNVSNPIQIEGPGSFRVPTNMYKEVPFEILAGGIAEFEVLEGTQVLSGQLTGAGAVKKTGAGTLEITHANTFSGGTTIDAGTIRLANTETDDYSLGNAGSAVTVNAGGTLDVNGQQGYGLHVTLNGGKIVNNGGNREYARQIDQLTLTANSTVGGTGKFGVLAYGAGKNNLTLNGFTLTKVDGNEFSFCNSAISAGKIRVEGGAVCAYRTGSSMTQVDIEVAAGGTLNSATAMSLKNLTVEENGTILPTNTITVNGTLTLAKAIKVIGAVDTVAMVKAGYEGELPLVTLLNANGTEVAGLYKLVKDGDNLKVAQITENTTFPINTAESAPQVIIDTAFIAETVDNVASKTGDEISEALSATSVEKPLSIAEAYVLGLTAEQAKSGQLVIKGAQTTSPNTMRIYVDGNPQVRPDTGVKVAYKVLVSSTPDGEEGDEIELGTESSAEVELPTEENEKVRYYKIKANITGSSQTVSSVSSASLASAAAGNLFAPTTVNGDVDIFAMTATSAIAEGTPLDLELGGTAFAEGQRFDLVVTPAASRAVTSATLTAERTLHFETPAIETGSTISVVAVNPAGLGTIKVNSYTFDGILMTCKDSTEKPLLKMIGNAPIADNSHNWNAAGKVDRTTEDTSANSGALYRIVAVAKGNGMVTTMFDARSNWKDLGQATVWNDWAGADSFDNGNSWTAARLMIDVPNCDDNVTPNTTGLDASVRKNCDLIDPCLGYDANRQKFVVMGMTGGGLAGAGSNGVNNDLVIYERDAVEDSEWTGRTSIEAEILAAITAAMNDGNNYANCMGILEGPGHAYTTTTDLVRGDITIPAGTPIFALQYFTALNYTSRTCAAWYTVDSNGVKTWHVTKLTDQGSQEPSLTVLDDGSLYMIGKGGGQRKAYRSKDYINWVAVDNVTADQSVQGTILKIGSKDGTGVYAHATPTSGRAQIKVFIGTDNSASAGTAPIRWNTSTPIANVWPDSCWTGGYTTMFMIDEHTLGVIFEVQSHVYLNAVDVSAYVD